MSRQRVFGLAACALLLLVLTAIGLDRQRHDDIIGFVAVALAQGAVYLFAARQAWSARASRRGVLLILAAAAALRLPVLLAPPYLSTDIYRYVWDGRVLAAGINPYRFIPTDPHLAALRDPEIFPNVNRNNYAPTIYPPVAELIFYGVTRISDGLIGMKAAMVVFEAIAIGLLLSLLISQRQPTARIIIYAWHPLPVWEFAGSGHIDAAIIAFVALALWSRRRAHRRLTALALAAAALVKFYPAAIVPALWRRRDWRMPAFIATAVVLAYLPFLGVGSGVLGFLPHYMTEEGFASGAGFYLLSALHGILPTGPAHGLAYAGAAGMSLIGLAAYVVFSRTAADAPVFAATLLAAAFIFLLSPHYPWYFAWLLVFACLVPSPSLLWLTLTSFLLYLVPAGSQFVFNRNRFIVESLMYAPFVALAAADLLRRRRRREVREQPVYGESAG